MNKQSQIRKDIEYLLSKIKDPRISALNKDITSVKSFDGLPVALVGVRPTEKTEKNQNDRQLSKYRIDLSIIFAKLEDDCDTETLSERYDREINQMSNVVDAVHLGMTTRYLKKDGNPLYPNKLAIERNYESDGSLSIVSTFFRYGSNNYMKIDALFYISTPYNECIDCALFDADTFDQLP